MIQYYNLPDLLADIIKRKIKKLQDFLVAGRGHEEGVVLYLDGRPNPDLDDDPGAISGDCTEGAPLPFAEPNVPVYNVKVFSGDTRHIGNIYLLVTSTDTGTDSLSVWHLDAIQIPEYRVDWLEAIPQIINAIGSEAEKKDIDMITVNDNEIAISNYDYISEAVEAIWKQQGAKTTEINMHDEETASILEDGEYSQLQGKGYARIIWENETKNSHPRPSRSD